MSGGEPPTLPPLPTSEALFSPKNSPNLDTIGSPQPRSIASTQNQRSAVDDIVDIEAAYNEHGVVVRFKAIGAAPIMKQNFYKISDSNKFSTVIQFLRKECGLSNSNCPVFCYVNSAFAPSPDDSIGNLYKCYGTDGHVIVNYSTSVAWG
ncbi:hypothetical protein E3P89_01324 [Wallemia ichthyophaga]|uniref:Ubiquitin-like protein ATG12 n=1 Tax=Wallemia ichthyophaga TaxID=245174 RepID=A0A4T0HFK1_WALIC|nr:hypothetical protein E3P98_01586 [Wallemia ichthyophaga]TIA94254.1 hypothetical protein E3P97_00222 [Wallemia ichthyophaga]TIB13252.1 hypothetical protein E3P90_01724 [Wallemia ichthyophaga]TIB14956.1 hypothetical protein E3P93_01474 [Wallemia ichthyophaga]TIB23899.1 hypothetical protein E3P89_01324 [Wallemia ichthyophaga]